MVLSEDVEGRKMEGRHTDVVSVVRAVFVDEFGYMSSQLAGL